MTDEERKVEAVIDKLDRVTEGDRAAIRDGFGVLSTG